MIISTREDVSKAMGESRHRRVVTGGPAVLAGSSGLSAGSRLPG